jgi:hypothetical protein
MRGAAAKRFPGETSSTVSPPPLPQAAPKLQDVFPESSLSREQEEPYVAGAKMSFARFRHIVSVNYGLSTEERAIRDRVKTLQHLLGTNDPKDLFERLAQEGHFKTS